MTARRARLALARLENTTTKTHSADQSDGADDLAGDALEGVVGEEVDHVLGRGGPVVSLMIALAMASNTPMMAPPAINPEAIRTPRSVRALTSASLSPRLVAADEPGQDAAQQHRRVELHGQVHAEGEGQRRNAGHAQDQREQDAEAEEVPLQGRGLAPKIPTRISFMAEAWGAGMLAVPKPWPGRPGP